MMPNNSQEIAQLLYDKLIDNQWKILLRSFVKSSDFYSIIDKLKENVDNNLRFVPAVKKIFNPFIYCEYDNLKVVFLADESYNSIELADGLAFSCPNALVVPEEQNKLQAEISKKVYKNGVKKFNSELQHWSMQGILLLNSALTAEIGRKGKHYSLWKPFISYIVDMLNAKKDNLIFVFFGENAQKYSVLIDKNKHTIFKLDIPIANKQWDSQDIFNKINNILVEKNENSIAW